jgi:hypothetical protein
MRFFGKGSLRKRLRASGQALILIVLTFMGMLLFLGLMVDLGQIFLAKGYLRRAADAASLAAAAQFRENRTITEMEAAAREVSRMNGIDPTTIGIQTCKEGDPGPDTSLCPPAGKMPKKLVRVTIELDYPMTFLTLIDINSVHLKESSVSEAAAMDVVLVIDVSESMTWDNHPNPSKHGPEDPANPVYCNAYDTCEPFKHVKDAAVGFASEILNKPPGDEEDRLAVVTFATGWQAGELGTRVLPMTVNGWTNDISVALDPVTGIPGLKVYDPGVICPYGDWGCPDGPFCPADQDSIPASACIYYGNPEPSGKYNYYGLHCARTLDIETADGNNWSAKPEAISTCGTTNIGGGLRLAGEQFTYDKRPDALWVVVLLTDGAANATFGIGEDDGSGGFEILYPPLDPVDFIPNLPLGYCPSGDWVGRGTGEPNRQYCQDGDVDTTHSPKTDAMYDADDFARDQGKFVACWATNPAPSCGGQKGQGAVIFTIGLGDEILALDNDPFVPDRKPYGATLLRYLAAIGDDGDADTDPCALETDYSKGCGNYFYAAAGADLNKVFEMIYSRIFTRLTA